MSATEPNETPAFFQRFGKWILLVALLASPIITYGSWQSLNRFANDIKQWLPAGFEEADTYIWFLRRFGADEIVVISWPDCTLDDSRVAILADALMVPDENGKVYFQQTSSGEQIVRQLTGPPLRLKKDVAFRRIRGLFLGPDEKTTCVVAWVDISGGEERARTIQRIYDVAKESCQLEPDQLRLGGPTVDGAAMDTESRRSLYEQAGFAVLFIFFVAWIRFRRFKLVMLTVLTGIYAAGVASSILYFSGGYMNLTMVMMPTIVFVLTISASVHLINYFRNAELENLKKGTVERAVKLGLKPCLLAATTTAIGLGSLMISQVTPIRSFGIYASLGLLAGLPLILLLLPAGLSLLRIQTAPAEIGKGLQIMDEANGPLARFVCRRNLIVVIALVFVMVMLGLGSIWVESTVKIQQRFSDRTKIISDYKWLEANLGPLVPLEIVIHMDQDPGADSRERLKTVTAVERAVRKSEDVRATLSANLFRPVLPRGDSVFNTGKRSLIIDGWKGMIPKMIESGLIANTENEQLWRITARVNALNNIDYGDFVDELRVRVRTELEKSNVEVPAITYTGGIPLIYKAQQQILIDLVKSFCGAFVVIAVVFIIILRSIRAGILAMIPNVFPVVVVIGGMGWLSILIDIGSVMTASVALGIAVDDTFHFLTWYRRGVEMGRSREQSIRFAYYHCAQAMIDTTIICSVGVLPFVVSSFVPTVRFALLMIVLLLAAIIGDLVLLPSILASPMGNLFRRRGKATERDTTKRNDA